MTTDRTQYLLSFHLIHELTLRASKDVFFPFFQKFEQKVFGEKNIFLRRKLFKIVLFCNFFVLLSFKQCILLQSQFSKNAFFIIQ